MRAASQSRNAAGDAIRVKPLDLSKHRRPRLAQLAGQEVERELAHSTSLIRVGRQHNVRVVRNNIHLQSCASGVFKRQTKPQRIVRGFAATEHSRPAALRT